MRTYLRLAGLLLAASILCSCASISMVDSWRNPSMQGTRMHRVLVVSITKKDANRAVYEDLLASELASHQVEAIASHTLMPSSVKTGRDALDEAVKKSGSDSVLTVQTVKVERQTTIQQSLNATYPGYWYPQAFPTWDLYGYYGSMDAYGPTYISSYDVATLQVNVFDAATGKLLWAATLSSSEPEKVVTVAKDLARLVAENLAKADLL